MRGVVEQNKSQLVSMVRIHDPAPNFIKEYFMAVAKSKKKNPMLTKNGKQRLGPLNVEQLTKMLDGARKKHKAKIVRRIAVLESR